METQETETQEMETETQEMVLRNTIQDTGDLMPARRKTCLKPTSAVKAQAFAKAVPYDGIAIISNRNVDDNLK